MLWRNRMPTLHKKRPQDKASQRAWDYVVAKHGVPDSIIFICSCCAPGYWSVKVKDKLISIFPKEMKDFGKKLGKI